MNEILKLLERDAELEPAEIAECLGRDEAEVRDILERCKREGIIMGRAALIDWNKVQDERVTALIEVKIAPQRGEGFDRIARRIYQYDEVESLTLMSGAYDLAVTIQGKSLQAVAGFVAQNLATIDGVTGTATHFVLKRYKEKHKIYGTEPQQEERVRFV